MKNKTVLVTGGLGYIGNVLTSMLLNKKYKVKIIDNDLYSLHYHKANYIHLDITDKNKLEKYIKSVKPKPVAIINLAAVVGDPACLVNPKLALEINCIGTSNLVEIANKYKIKVIHASSCSLYGVGDCTLENPLTEKDNLYTVDIYGLTKLQQEKIVTSSARDYLVFRLGTAYGISERMKYDLVINLFSALTANSISINVFGGEQYRPFVHVLDVARTFIWGLEQDLWGVYNLISFNITIKELANYFVDLHYATVNITKEIQDPRNYIVSNKKLTRTGFQFKESLIQNIKDLVDYSNQLKSKEDYRLPKYSNKKLMEEVINK